MKKLNIQQIILLAFAVAAVYISSMPGSVTVYDLTQIQEPFRCSYFTLVEGVTGSICVPAAGLCACATLLLGGISVALDKKKMLSAVKILAFAGACLAVVPILFRGSQITLVPNALMPIAMLGEYVMANYLQKKEQSADREIRGERL